MTELREISDADLIAMYQAKQPKAAAQRGGGAVVDVAKGAATGLVRGVETLAGLPGDVSDLIGRGLDMLPGDTVRGWLGKPPLTAEQKEQTAYRNRMLPTSQQIIDAESAITGGMPQPETRAGKFARTAAEFVPPTVFAPARSFGQAVGNAIRYGMLPGAASEAAGQLTEGSPIEPYARAGAGLAAGVGAAVTARPSSAAQAISRQLPDYVTPQHIEDAFSLINEGARRGVKLTWAEALSQVTGKPVLTDMQRVAESAPRSRAAMQEFYHDRPDQAWRATLDELDRLAPPTIQPSMIGRGASDAARAVTDDVRKGINRFTQPLYEAAAQQKIPEATMKRLRALPGYDEARSAILDNPQLARYVGGLTEDSVGFQNEIKKFLDQRGSNASSRFNPAANQQVAAGYSSDAAAVRQAGVDVSPSYEQALKLQEQLREQFLEPLLAGPIGRLARKDTTTQSAIEALFPSQPLAGSQDEIATAVKALAARNAPVARSLVRAHLEAKLNEAFYAAGRGQEAQQFAGATFASRAAGSPAVDTQRLENLRAAVEALPNGAATWAGFERMLDVLRATGTRQPIGSKTAWNALEAQSMSSGGMLGNAAKVGASPGKWLTFATDQVSAWQLGRNLDQIAAILTDPDSARLLRRLAQMPGGSERARSAAARIIVQTAGDARARTAETRGEASQ